MSKPLIPNPAARRHFLRHAGRLVAMGAGAPMALNLSLLGAAAAQGASDFKALVCVYLDGGNDAFNTVLPTDGASWAAYQATRRGGEGLALAPVGTPAMGAMGSAASLGGVLPLYKSVGGSASCALHPSLQASQHLFNRQARMAVVANVGPLVAPTSKAQWTAGSQTLPPKLGSHNDQSSLWLSLGAEGTPYGWAGRMADLLVADGPAAAFAAMSTTGRTVWNSGTRIQALTVTPGGGLPFGTDAGGLVQRSPVAAAALLKISSRARSGNLLEQAWTEVVARSQANNATLATAMPPAHDSRWSGQGTAGTGLSLQYRHPINGTVQANPLAEQLQTAARFIAAGADGTLGTRRQVLFVRLKGFDTHDNQASVHADLMAQLDHGLAYFDTVLGTMGLRNQVTTFTASEFGRSFTSNDDGTDHGWGGHHLVMGGAVQGGAVYGRLPVLGIKNIDNNRFDSSDDQIANGALLPAIAVEQLASELAQWFGLSYAQCKDIMPRLARFNRWNAGLMKG